MRSVVLLTCVTLTIASELVRVHVIFHTEAFNFKIVIGTVAQYLCNVMFYIHLRSHLVQQETWIHSGFQGLILWFLSHWSECPPWCSIVGATVTVHEFFCVLFFMLYFTFKGTRSQLVCLFTIIIPFLPQTIRSSEIRTNPFRVVIVTSQCFKKWLN